MDMRQVKFPSTAVAPPSLSSTSIQQLGQISRLEILRHSINYYYSPNSCFCESNDRTTDKGPNKYNDDTINGLNFHLQKQDSVDHKQQQQQQQKQQHQHLHSNENTLDNFNSFKTASAKSDSESCTSCLLVGIGTCTAMTAYFAYVAYEPRTAIETTIAKYQQRKVFCLAVSAGWACLGIYRFYLG